METTFPNCLLVLAPNGRHYFWLVLKQHFPRVRARIPGDFAILLSQPSPIVP